MTPSAWRRWQPALVESLATYDRRTFLADLSAGITVGLVALPLALAFGIASGVTPQAGIYTAILGGAIAAALGGSKLQVSGPTGAFVVIVAGIITQHGLSGLLMVTMMAGVLLILMSLAGLARAIAFIPRPVVVGFTHGIAVLIAVTQIRDLLGLTVTDLPSEFFARAAALWDASGSANPFAIAIAAGALALVIATPRLAPRLPGSVVALVAATAAVALFDLPVETIGSRFGALPGELPAVDVPEFKASLILPLLPSAVTVALLAAVESLLSAVVADSLTGSRHNSDAELLAQGVANVASPLVGGIPVTGAIARTATNIRAGAKTPVSALIHAAVLAAVVLVLAPLAGGIPLAALGAILLVVAWTMGDWGEIGSIWKLDLADRSVWLITFALTVVADLTIAVEVGMVLAALLYIRRVTDTTSVEMVTPAYVAAGRPHVLQDKDIPPFVTILRIHGPFLFGVTDKLHEATRDPSGFGPIVVLRLRNMTAIDATGLHALEQLHDRLAQSGRTLLLCGLRSQPAEFLDQAEFVDHIGAGNILPHVQAAIDRAHALHRAG